MRLVRFKKSQQNMMKLMMEKKQPVHIDDCQIKSVKRGNKLEILLKSSSKIAKSPKKIGTSNMTSQNEDIRLVELDAKNEYDQVSTKIKVVKIIQTVTVSLRKTIQEVLVADSSGVTRCSLWEQDIGALCVGLSYHLKIILKCMSMPRKSSLPKPYMDVKSLPFPTLATLLIDLPKLRMRKFKNAQN